MVYVQGIVFQLDDWTPENTPARVRALREAKGMTQTDLSVALDISGPSTISRWESGKFSPDRRARRSLYAMAEAIQRSKEASR